MDSKISPEYWSIMEDVSAALTRAGEAIDVLSTTISTLQPESPPETGGSPA